MPRVPCALRVRSLVARVALAGPRVRPLAATGVSMHQVDDVTAPRAAGWCLEPTLALARESRSRN